jgi:hypothetical protein
MTKFTDKILNAIGIVGLVAWIKDINRILEEYRAEVHMSADYSHFDLPLTQYQFEYEKWLEAGWTLSQAKHKYTAMDFEILMNTHIANEPILGDS